MADGGGTAWIAGTSPAMTVRSNHYVTPRTAFPQLLHTPRCLPLHAARTSNLSFQSKLGFKSVCHFSPAHEHARSSQAFVSCDELLVPYHRPFPSPYFSPDLGIANSNFLSGATIRFDLGLMWDSFSRLPGRPASMSRSAPPKSSCSDPNSACLPRSSNEYLPDRRLLRGTLTASTEGPPGSAISCDSTQGGCTGRHSLSRDR